jgi:hypothetical protein
MTGLAVSTTSYARKKALTRSRNSRKKNTEIPMAAMVMKKREVCEKCVTLVSDMRVVTYCGLRYRVVIVCLRLGDFYPRKAVSISTLAEIVVTTPGD